MEEICAQCMAPVATDSGFTTPQGHLLCPACYVTLWRPDTPPRPGGVQTQESRADLRQL